MLMQLIVPVYVPDRSVCSPPVLAVVAAPAEEAAVERRRPRRRLRPPLPVLPFAAVPLMFVLSPVAAPMLASPVLALASPAALELALRCVRRGARRRVVGRPVLELPAFAVCALVSCVALLFAFCANTQR